MMYPEICIRSTVYIPSNWKDIRIADMDELSEIFEKEENHEDRFQKNNQ